MKALKRRREESGLSQRGMASAADVSYKTIQLVESGDHNVRVSTLETVASALGYPPHFVEHHLETLFALPTESIAIISERLRTNREDWRIPFFEFVDAFRAHRLMSYVNTPPTAEIPARIHALLASGVEALCHEMSLTAPRWCATIPPLDTPWFVTGIENLKAIALLESPVWFRQRNIFVLGNFLERK